MRRFAPGKLINVKLKMTRVFFDKEKYQISSVGFFQKYPLNMNNFNCIIYQALEFPLEYENFKNFLKSIYKI